MLNQNDVLWKLKKINGTTYTIGGWGCLITDVCFLLGQAGYNVTPDELAKKSELFDGAMWIGWDKLQSLYPNMNYVWGERCTDYPAPVDKIIKELDDGFFPIIMLDFAPKTTGLQTHYLVCLGHDDKGNIKVGDPIDGQEVWLDSRYGELDEKYKIMKVDVYHFQKPLVTTPDLWTNIKGLLTVENNFSESDIRAMVDWYKLKNTTERTIKDLNDGLVAKSQKLVEKDNIISELNNQLNGKDESIKHYVEFQEKLSSILNCKSDQGEILASVVTAIGNESKLQSCLSNNSAMAANMNTAIADGVDKGTFELRVKVADLNMQISKRDKDIAAYQKKIDMLTLGKTVVSTPIALKIRNLFSKLWPKKS